MLNEIFYNQFLLNFKMYKSKIYLGIVIFIVGWILQLYDLLFIYSFDKSSLFLTLLFFFIILEIIGMILILLGIKSFLKIKRENRKMKVIKDMNREVFYNE
jgi:hypothetical protein